MSPSQGTVVRVPESSTANDLDYWQLNDFSLKGKNLIVACGSFASIEGLACDYLIESMNLHRIGVFTSPYIDPLVQTLDDGNTVTTGMELYAGAESDCLVLQLRTSYKKKRLFGRALSRWIADSDFGKVVAVSSMSSHVQDDHDLVEGTPLRAFRSQDSFGLPSIDRKRIVGGGLLTRLDEDIPGIVCFAKGTDVEKIPLAKITADFLLTNICGRATPEDTVEPPSWKVIKDAGDYGRYDDEDDLRRMGSRARVDGRGTFDIGRRKYGYILRALNLGYRGGKLNSLNTTPHVACPSGGTSADGHINSTSLALGKPNRDDVWNFSMARPNDSSVHYKRTTIGPTVADTKSKAGRALVEATKLSEEQKEATGGFDFDPAGLTKVLPWTGALDVRTGHWRPSQLCGEEQFNREVGLGAVHTKQPVEEVDVPPHQQGTSEDAKPRPFERHGFIFDEYKRHQYHGYARNHHGGLWKCESHTGPG
ncbi:Proteasome assembly chaperone 2 [Perkinsus chesapeaki]|uniref:Proteasome assembly chaperone 2 n=1 Tax=Perkinsus chesapeaki TaxID=330153 RepID=A0A7J6MLN9_PERCH|nr:Proteasome assembly chaperone 2 [Perkinsus chesapeaki]